MYPPASFRVSDLPQLQGLMRTHPLGQLISHGPEGLAASPIPFFYSATEGEFGVLRAHLARANPHWRQLQAEQECLVIFQGPDNYVTPSWYPSKAEHHQVVPTWNYATVHAWGRPQVIDDPAWLRQQLQDFVTQQEAIRPCPWAVSDAPDAFIAKQMQAIIGLEIPITRLEGKWKMSQNRPPADRQGVFQGLADPQDPHHCPAMGQYSS